MSYVGEKPSSPQFAIYPDDKGQAETTLYEDDGLSPAYKQGSFRRTRVHLSGTARRLQLNVDAAEGRFQTGPRVLEFVLPIIISPVSVLIDNKAIPPTGRNGVVWSKRGNTFVIRLPDDGKPHTIEVR